MAERFDGTVEIDGDFVDPGKLRVNGTVQMGPGGGEGALQHVARIEHAGLGEIECGHLVAHHEIECGQLVAKGDAETPAASFRGNVDVYGNINVHGDINIADDDDSVSERLDQLEKRIDEISKRTKMPDGRSVVNAIGNLEELVKQLRHDTKPWWRGGALFNPDRG